MKMLKFLFFNLVVLHLTACGSDEIKDAVSIKPQTKSIEKLNGSWTSGCIDSEYGAYYGRRIITQKFSENKFETYIDRYYANDCATVPDKTTSYIGTYKVQKRYDTSTVLLQYTVPVDEQIWQLLSQKIQITDAGMITSELMSGFEKDNDYTLKLVMKRL